MIKESGPAFSDTKEKARADFIRTHRSQNHGTRGTLRGASQGMVDAPRRVKAANAHLSDFDSITDTAIPTHDGLKKMRRKIPQWLIADPSDEYHVELPKGRDETALLDPDSPEYELAFDELEAFLNRNGIVGEERAYAAEAFKADSSIQRELLELSAGLSADSFATSYDQVDAANRLSPRSTTDYLVEGSFDDDDGDYHLPHMSVR